MAVSVNTAGRTPKKTVKFSDNLDSIDQLSKAEELDNVEPQDSIVTPFTLKTVPIHFLLIPYFILQQDLSHSNVFSNLLNQLYILIISQVVYTFLFVSNIIEITKKNRKKKRVTFNFLKDYSYLLIGFVIAILLILPIYILVVLFGAPFTTYFKENIVLASHLSFISYPVIISFLKIGEKPQFYKYLISTGVGAWLGAIAIPLDWERPWQNWPLPIVISAYVGSFIGYFLGGLIK